MGQSQQGGPLALAAGFPAADEAAWRAQVDAVLAKGLSEPTPEALAKRFEKLLVGQTHEGLRIAPLALPQAEAPALGLPGQAPFLRGSRPLAQGWQLRQRVRACGAPEAVAKQVLAELEGGAEAVALDLSEAERIDAAYLGACLAGVLLEAAPIALEAGPRWAEAAEALKALWAAQGLAPEARLGRLGADPVGVWLQSAGRTDLAAHQAQANALAREALAWPGVKALVVDAALFLEAGGGEVAELAMALALGVHQQRELTAAGLSVDEALGQLEFRHAATPDQFLSLAKLRAGRRLWQRVAEACGASESAQAASQHAVTALAHDARHDPWVNALRHTVGAFAAGVGGAEAVTVLPHDLLLVPGGSDPGRRLARNTQLLLLEEAHLGLFTDLAGGSHHVEALSEDLAQAAWAFFQEVEAAGGAVEALRQGLVQARIAATRAKRDAAIAKRSHPLTGLSEFPNVQEAPPPAWAPSPEPEAGPIQALRPRRHAEGFEAQRARADRKAAEGQRPRVFLAALGPPSAFTARATFAKNLFEAGGIQAELGEGFADAASALAAWEASGAEFACLCSSDAAYASLALPVAKALKGAKRPPLRLYLAGRPSEPGEEALRAAGVDEQFALGVDVLALLTRALDLLDVAPVGQEALR